MIKGRQLNGKLADTLNAHSRQRDFTLALFLLVLTASGSLLLTAYKMGYEGGGEASEAVYSKVTASHVNFPYILNIIRINITIALISSAIGLWSRKVAGFFLSTLSLLWIVIIYIWWYFDSLTFLRNAEVSDYSKLPDVQHTAMFRGAYWWDIIILAAIITLLAWQIKTLISILKSPGKMQ